MYRCESCGGTFEHFKTAGQCPLCKVWASVRCQACKFTAHANEFINNNDSCPKCGAKVSIPGSGGSSGCFVATAAFADPDAPEVRTLRAYRDLVLARTSVGRFLIGAYYRFGPGLAAIVCRCHGLGWVARAVLRAVAKSCKPSLHRR